MATAYKTINLAPTTYEQLSLYKVGQMTYDEVITNLMDEVEPEVFYRGLLVLHKKRMAKMEQGEEISIEEAEKLLAEED